MFNPSYLAFQRQNIQNGNIANLGEGSVDAESTEVGKYQAAVKAAIGRKWHEYRRRSDVNVGYLRVKFFVTPKGNVRNLRIITKEASELVVEFSLRAIVDAKIPPMPEEVWSKLGPNGIELDYDIAIY